MARARFRSDHADRQVGWLIAASSLLLGVWWLPDALAQWERFAPWWNLGAWLSVASVLTLAAAGPRLPMGLLRGLWLAAPALLVALQFASFGAVLGEPSEVLPWIWLLESIAVCLLALRLPPAGAIAAAVTSALSVPISAWVFTGAVSHLVLTNLPLRLANIALIALLLGVRRRLAVLHETEALTRAVAERRARSEAETDEQARFARFVHDEVLSVLTAAHLFSGDPPPELRAEAAAAIRALSAEQAARRVGLQRIDPVRAAERLRARLLRIAPHAEIIVEAGGRAH